MRDVVFIRIKQNNLILENSDEFIEAKSMKNGVFPLEYVLFHDKKIFTKGSPT